MKENIYDKQTFFEKYSRMDRSVHGLKSAGEWHRLQQMLPDVTGMDVLDLGCGYGWHCAWVMERGASSATGIDISKKMLLEAKKRHASSGIQFVQMALEDLDFPENTFDLALSSLAFHYVSSFQTVCEAVYRCLKPGGYFVFSVEHPVFTAYGSQDWHRDDLGEILHWPVDRYFEEGRRNAVFLGEAVVKYHRTITTYYECLVRAGFTVTGFAEPKPSQEHLETIPGMQDELRRPMMMILSSRKL